MQEVVFPKKNWVTRRFVFRNTKLAELKSMVASSGVETPTRVEVLSALLYKCAMSAAKSNSTGSFSPSVMFQAMNMRAEMVPPLSENFSWKFYMATIRTNYDRGRVELEFIN